MNFNYDAKLRQAQFPGIDKLSFQVSTSSVSRVCMNSGLDVIIYKTIIELNQKVK